MNKLRRLRTSLICISILAMSSCFSNLCYSEVSFCQTNRTLNCLKNNFDQLYRVDPELFWKILEKAEKSAVSCQNTSDTVSFIKLASFKTVNAEFREYLADTLEGFFLIKRTCFLNAASSLPKNDIDNVAYILARSLFGNEESIKDSFMEEQKKRNKRYKYIIDRYFIEEAKVEDELRK
jgi:hypothetical protein